MIYVNDRFKPKRKSKKPIGEVYEKYKPSKKFVEYASNSSTIELRFSTKNLPSHGMSVGNTERIERPKYTGDKLLGIAVMHKSNLVPVFKAEDAIDIARMRRG
jgi:hypothetical protein